MRDTVVVSVRMPEKLRQELSRRADADYRSLSQEIVWLLSLALDTLDAERGDRPQGKSGAAQ